MEIHVKPIRGIRGTFTPPGDKSISHRAIILGSLALGTSKITGYLEAQDTLKTLEALKALGVNIRGGGGCYEVLGRKWLEEPENILDLGNSGTGLRLLCGVLVGERGIYSVLTGDSSLRSRPMDRIILPLKEMGASITARKDNTLPPLTIMGQSLKPIIYRLPIPSAQVKSALLLAGLKVPFGVKIEEPIPCRDHTERMMISMGIPLEKRGNLLSLKGPARPKAFQIQIPGDLSSAAFLVVAALITPKSFLEIRGVGLNPTRSAFLQVLLRMGAKIEVKNKGMTGGEPQGDLVIKSSDLKGVSIGGQLIPLLIDEIPALVVAAVMAKGETSIQGARELRFKESDRIHSLVQEFSALGAHLQELPDGMVIKGTGELLGGAECDSHLDHRVGMALVLAGLSSKEGILLKGGDSIKTSFPGFFKSIQELSIN